MCDVCADFLHLLISYESRITINESEHQTLHKSEVEIAFGYIQTWTQRQCMCCYRDIKNFERFNLIIQSLICLTVCQLKNIKTLLNNNGSNNNKINSNNNNNNESVEVDNSKENKGLIDSSTDEEWTLPEIEKLLMLISKVFLLNFPLYVAYKHGVHSRLDEISGQEAQSLNLYCDLHDSEIPAFLLRNVSLFCNSGGFSAMKLCFEQNNLPVSTAHAITAAVSNLKLWLNYRSIIQHFVPLRIKVLQYMCKLADQDLRSQATKSMADFMWAAIKDPLDSQISFDTEGLALAFKYFTSSTLTMRLAGMAQINAHINLFNEICTSETVAEVEIVGQRLANWLTENQIITHLFGPNLHVEVIKQSHIVLNFLAVESQISEEHMNLIWQAAQLKHCSKPIFDILPSLVKNLAPRPALHLYSLLCNQDPKEHTAQSIYITSALTKLIWSRQQGIETTNTSSLLRNNIAQASSSENSVSIDGSNSDDEHQDDDSSDGHKSGEGGSDSGAPPCKQPRHKHCCGDAIIDNIKSEDIEEAVKLSKNSSAISIMSRRITALADGSSSEDGIESSDKFISLKKKLRKRKKTHNIIKKKIQVMVETASEVESHSDADVGVNDSDCSETPLQTSVLEHLHEDGPFIGALSDGIVENDGSYSSPMSNKSEKNMADFDDEESPCDEELAQLAARSHCAAAFSLPRTRTLSMRDTVGCSSHSNTSSNNSRKLSNKNSSSEVGSTKEFGHSNAFKISDVCQPGNTLLWDLLQDEQIGQLGETLALEAEKVLGTLLCFNTDHFIRTKFIEGCLQNIAVNKSVVVSLRLLPKLFASFQQYRAHDTHQVTLWAERQHKMMYHFFNNLKFYAASNKNGNPRQIYNQNGEPMYSHMTEVQVRLQFLTSVFSAMGSPETFRLTLEQVDALWSWLSNDAECADCLFAWLQGQAKASDQHALGIDSLQHLYLKKLPELKPEGITMIALGLFQHLCTLARLAASHYDSLTDSSLDIVGMNHLWKIALRANNTDVSLAAIQYINSYYMGQQLKLEKEFVAQCMNHLTQASDDLHNFECQENALMCVQRALMLLNTHLETFRRRYAYHLRRWALDGRGIGSHSVLRNEGPGPPIRVILQPGGLPDKSVLHLNGSDLIADLKAEIAKWWENLQGGARTSGATAPVLGLLLSEGPLRIITQGQEITAEYDERSLSDVGFKDNQMVYVSLGGRGGRRRDPSDHPSLQPPPPKECLPTVLLLQPQYFEQLFKLMQSLSHMKMPGKGGNLMPHTKAQLLSRRVWDILAMLPTSPNLLNIFKSLPMHEDKKNKSFENGSNIENNKRLDETRCLNNKNLSEDTDAHNTKILDENNLQNKIVTLQELLDPKNLQKFMYSLHIVESLCKTKYLNGDQIDGTKENSVKGLKSSPNSKTDRIIKKIAAEIRDATELVDVVTNDSESDMDTKNKTEENEIEMDSVKKLTSNIVKNNVLKEESQTPLVWSDVFIKCGGLRHLLDIFMSGVLQNGESDDECNEWRQDCLASLLRILYILGVEEMKPEETLLNVPKLNEPMYAAMPTKPALRCFASILNEASLPANPHQFKTGFWGRSQIVHFTMNLLVSLIHSSAHAREILWSDPDICNWLQRLILDDPEPSVRREACAGLYRICLGNSKTYHELMAPLLSKLVDFLPVAEKMQQESINMAFTSSDEGKEPYGPACRDYFWLLCRLVDALTPDMVKECLDNPQIGTVDIESLCRIVSKAIMERDYIETRHGNQDDGLVGLINLMATLVKYDPPYKFSTDGQIFVETMFTCLFDLPSPQNRLKPKCKSQSSRAAAYDLLVDLCKNAPKNYALLHEKLLEQHKPGPHSPYPWDYWPRDDGRSECGYVGLTNLGATCYMASCIQHLYMMPQAREAILSVPREVAQKHSTTLYELQRMFAYLMESERKSYNPRSFCRVYQMDHQPLNTGEQKDMAEFFIDLVSKLEEMTPDLKSLIKRLFCGVLSNNVVSLDCGHVSRTLEEFYTVRCQVADMRNLHESLDEVTVKDTLEGDNMYTCSQCGRKVRAEKRACFKKLPQILCFNTMRYTFNMITMLKEKVNTHFSFPMRLDMSGYVEKTLMPHHYMEEKLKSEEKQSKSKECERENNQNFSNVTGEVDNTKEIVEDRNEQKAATKTDKIKLKDIDQDSLDKSDKHYEYDLVGVTVHTGTADGGHYYSFIKERNLPGGPQDRWFLFNDAEVKIFDPSQIAAECFGGEMTSKTYDAVSEKYLDFSFEKTNSAYMLFYEKRTDKCINIDTNCEQLYDFDSSVISCNNTTTNNNNYTRTSKEIDIQIPSCSGHHQIDNKIKYAEATIKDKNNKDNNEIKLNLNIDEQEKNETEVVNSDLLINSNISNNKCDIDVKCKTNENITTNVNETEKNLDANIITSKAANVNVITSASISSSSSTASSSSSSASNQKTTISSNIDLENFYSNTYRDQQTKTNAKISSLLTKELEEWIWQDNRHFLQDRNIFEHTYFNFMWQICGHIPQTLLMQEDITCIAAQLSVSFFIETFIHAKEKPTMVLWVEFLTKQFNASQEACEWFLTHMSTEPWWPVQVLIQCPNQMVRQMFQRLVIHVVQRLRQSHYILFLNTDIDDDGKEIVGNSSCVTRFIKSLILLMEHGAKAHLRHLSEFFGLLYEFSRMGDEETLFLLKVNVIRSVTDFYLGHKNQDCIDTNSDNDENSSDEALSIDKARPASLDKMIALVATLVERSRGPDLRLHLSTRDYNAIAGGKGFPFLYQQIKDNINPHQTRHLIHALCRWDERLANQIVAMLFQALIKHTELCGPFFKLLTLLTESTGGPSGLPCFSQLILQRVWDAAEYCPQSALEWLAVQAPRNKIAHAWILQSSDSWVEQFLIAHNNTRVRNAAAYLLISLVPSQSFRANYRTSTHNKLLLHTSQRELSSEAQIILHTIINLLLRLLRAARGYTDIAVHGTGKLTAYFGLLTYCMVSRTEKLLLGPHIRLLWELFHPRLSEPSVPAHHNKQSLLVFWYHATVDCPENALIVANSPELTRNIAFNYILADHEDTDIIAYNRAMLPAYYGLLRLCCQQSRTLTRQLAGHQNLQWAFKNITPYITQYSLAVDELFRLMTLFATRHPDATEVEQREVSNFRRTTLQSYLTHLDARVSWGTLIAALRILVDNDEDRMLVIFSGGLSMTFESLLALHSMYHEATACHVSGDLQELLTELLVLVNTLRLQSNRCDQKKRPTIGVLKGLSEAVRRLATLLNTFNPPEMRNLALNVLKELVKHSPTEVICVLAPLLSHCHVSTQSTPHSIGPLGPYFPRRASKSPWPTVNKVTPRPPRPMVQMSMPQSQIIQKGIDKDFDNGLEAFYRPYHDFLDVMLRVAVTTNQLNEPLVKLSCLAGLEAAVLHFNLFPKFWTGIYKNKSTNHLSELLINCPYLIDYIDAVLRDERISLNDPLINSFMEIYYPKITSRLVITRLLDSICQILPSKDNLEEICGDLHAIRIIGQTPGGIPLAAKKLLQVCVQSIFERFKDAFGNEDQSPPKKRKMNASYDKKLLEAKKSGPFVSPACSSKKSTEVLSKQKPMNTVEDDDDNNDIEDCSEEDDDDDDIDEEIVDDEMLGDKMITNKQLDTSGGSSSGSSSVNVSKCGEICSTSNDNTTTVKKDLLKILENNIEIILEYIDDEEESHNVNVEDESVDIGGNSSGTSSGGINNLNKSDEMLTTTNPPSFNVESPVKTGIDSLILPQNFTSTPLPNLTAATLLEIEEKLDTKNISNANVVLEKQNKDKDQSPPSSVSSSASSQSE